jgi:hypothetical protein
MVDYRSANQISNYFEAIRTLLDHVARTQGKVMNEVAELLADTVVSNHTIYITGCSHSSIFAQEVYFRAGGFMLMNPLFLPGSIGRIANPKRGCIDRCIRIRTQYRASGACTVCKRTGGQGCGSYF